MKLEPFFLTLNIIIFVIGFSSIIIGSYLIFRIKSRDTGSKEMQKISKAIRAGSFAYIKREYFYVGIISIILGIILYFTLDVFVYSWVPFTLISFIVGTGSSLICGFIGMYISTLSNIRTASATQKSITAGLKIAFNGSAVIGLFIMGTGLIGVFGVYNFFSFLDANPVHLTGYGLGSSLVCIFSRVGGGIFTKSADIGADLVGKLEKGIPEDDPRNPGVIADNVGDNVGDCVGMSADLFESLTITLLVAMLISYEIGGTFWMHRLYFSVLVVCVGIISFLIAIITTNYVKNKGKPIKILNRGMLVAGMISIGLFGLMSYLMLGNEGFFTGNIWGLNIPYWLGVFLSSLIGLTVTIIVSFNTQFFTSGGHKPTKEIARAGETGPATNILKGYATGLKSMVIPGIMVVMAMVLAYELAGLFGIALSSLSLLSMTGMIQAIDTFGAISDNAGGIVEMSGHEELRDRTDILDEAGNTTAANAKGFAIISSGLVALATIGAVIDEAGIDLTTVSGIIKLSLNNSLLISGLIVGALVPLLFSSLLIDSVENTAYKMINEIRRQFDEIDGLMEGKANPNYRKCVDISTKGALKNLIIPCLMGLAATLVVAFILGKNALIGFLYGKLIVGLLMAVFYANAGGAWDNAKKWIEKGNLGGKGSEAHKSAVIGDTIGDPFKDTAGPSINSCIKLMNMVALLIAPILLF
ncbi:MAG: sodium-translocating pyrophosphatase [Candidatus Lokiarchaeota archaeon]|nr:sodium-translocating pyrophosphatase [Candidatus Lokiarchaeota archaeon]